MPPPALGVPVPQEKVRPCEQLELNDEQSPVSTDSYLQLLHLYLLHHAGCYDIHYFHLQMGNWKLREGRQCL